ncbi:hypothetical protein EDD15DRAFT_2372596 [Pisolithus albus]|nr:hypothetical protein EDD15DRAFT_2372596 [Pisolithus albus]
MSTSQIGPPAESAQTVQDDSLFQDDQMASYASANEEPQVETPRVQHPQLPDSAGQHGHPISPLSPVTSGKRQDKPTAPTTAEKCRYREVDFSASLRQELVQKERTVHRLCQKMREHGQSWTREHSSIQQAVGAVQQDFAKQSADMQAVILSQEAEMKALHSALQEYASHQEQVRQEREVADQKHREELDGFRSHFQNTIRAEMGELLKLSNTNLENMLQQREREMEEHLREEVEKSSRTMMVTKERELANLEQRYSRRGAQSSIHLTTVRDPATEINTPDQPFPPPDEQNLRTHTMPPSTSPGTGYALPRHSSTVTTPSLDAIKRIKQRRGISRTTRLIGVRMDDETNTPKAANAPQPSAAHAAAQNSSAAYHTTPSSQRSIEGSEEEHQPTKVLRTFTPESIATVVEQVLRNIFGEKGSFQSRAKPSPRRRKMEDEEVRRQKAVEPSVHRDFILNEVRCLFKEVFGIEQDIDFVGHQPAPVDDVQAYEHEDGPGPNSNKLAFDLSKNHTSPWNAEVIEVLLRKLQKCCEDENWPIKRSDSYIREILRYRYKKLRTVWLRAQPKLTRNGNPETPAEVEARMLAHLEKLGKESRQATHRRNKYKRRKAVLDYVVQLRTEAGSDDQTAWEWLQRLVKTLGEQGMSSEESAVENEIERVLRVKRMEWRRCIDRELDIIDVERVLDNNIFSPRGAKPVKRVRAPDNPVSSRGAVGGLPMELYDRTWIAGRTQREIESLDISEDKFIWMKVATV